MITSWLIRKLEIFGNCEQLVLLFFKFKNEAQQLSHTIAYLQEK
jgi:hypothetical protein